MKRTLSILATSLVFASSANAGFYVGPKIGATFNVGKSELQASQTNQEYGSAGDSFIGGVTAGYDYIMDSNIYMAGEVSMLFNSLNNQIYQGSVSDSDSGSAITSKFLLKSNFNYAVALKVGYQMKDNLTPYISLGGYGGQYKVVASVNSESIEIKKSIFGFAPGFGVKFDVNESLAGTIQYDYVDGGQIKSTDNDPVLGNLSYSTKIRQHHITAALLYKF